MTVADTERLAAQAIEAGAYEEAVELLRPLAEGNSEYALLALGWIHETGALGSVDEETARSHYERAAAGGSASAHLYLGRLHSGNGEDAKARLAFTRGAELNDEECRAELGRLSDRETEGRAAQAIEAGDYDDAAGLLRPLADKGSEYALLALGWIHEGGDKGPSDKALARSYYERAVANGSAIACFELGRLLMSQGEEEQARPAFATGAERGNAACMSRLGRMMVEGRGGPRDVAAGTAWLQKAVAQGHIMAERTLLAMDEENADSLFKKAFIKLKIASLTTKGARELLKDPDSDKVR